MRKLAILTFITLDGVMQSPTSPEEDSSGGFQNGGWAVNHWDEVMQQVTQEAMAEPYDLLLGRKTYDSFAGHFPQAQGNPVADMLNSAKKYVVTSADDELVWNNSHSVSGDIAQEIKHLKSQPGPLLQVHGSWQLIQTLHVHSLIDEYRLWIFPIVVGPGKRLFDETAPLEKLSLVKSCATANGAFMSIYEHV